MEKRQRLPLRTARLADGSDPHGDAEYGGEGFPKGSREAIAAMKKARKAQTSTAHFRKGSRAAHKKMAELRAMRDGDPNSEYERFKRAAYPKKVEGGSVRGPNPWLAFVKSYRSRHPEKTYKECLSAAAAEYLK